MPDPTGGQQVTPPFPGSSLGGGKKNYKFNPTTGQWEEGDNPPMAPNDYGYKMPTIDKSFFDPEKPPSATLGDWRQAVDAAGYPIWKTDPITKQPLLDEKGDRIPELRYMGEKVNPDVATYKAAGLEYYKLLQDYYNKTGDQNANTILQQLRNTGQIDVVALEGQNALNRTGMEGRNALTLAGFNQSFTAGQNQLNRDAQSHEAAQGRAFDWTKTQAGFGFQEQMQQASQSFQVQMQQAQHTWQGMENDKNRSIEMRRLAIEQGNLSEAVRHNQVSENLAMRQEIQKAKMDNLSMIQGILKDPAVFMMMRSGGFSFAQVSPEYGSLDRIPVPTVGTPQNLARWQAGSQFAQQQYLPGMAPGMPQPGNPPGPGPVPQQLTLGQVLPGVIPAAAGLPAWTPSPWNPQGGPQGSNQMPKGSEALY